MPLTNDELDNIEMAAHACDGEPFDYVAERIDFLAPLSEGELYAFAGMLFSRGCRMQADVVVHYISANNRSGGHSSARLEWQDPKVFLAEYLADREAEGAPLERIPF